MHLLSDLMKGKYVALRRTAEDRKEWQKLLRAGSYTPACQQTTWVVVVVPCSFWRCWVTGRASVSSKNLCQLSQNILFWNKRRKKTKS